VADGLGIAGRRGFDIHSPGNYQSFHGYSDGTPSFHVGQFFKISDTTGQAAL
jgi:hypothetical protein